MTYEPTHIIARIHLMARIQWCRHQQQLHSVTRRERAGWRAEEDGLVDAVGSRDRTAFMQEKHCSQLTRYQCGLEDGKALLRFSTSTPWGMTGTEGLGSAPLTTPAQVNSRPIQAPQPAHVVARP
jgi:hypothetical protein